MAKAKSNRRELLQLADTYDPTKHNIAGFYVSEKLDGTRCFWDGGLSRGNANRRRSLRQHHRPEDRQTQSQDQTFATGLWSRYGNPIIAPDWFLNCLPACPLDGELWAGRGKFQLCRSICGGDDPDPRFDQIQYAVYSSPALPYVFAEGEIKNANMVATFSGEAR
jgi:DNA ligase-1